MDNIESVKRRTVREYLLLAPRSPWEECVGGADTVAHLCGECAAARRREDVRAAVWMEDIGRSGEQCEDCAAVAW